VNVYQLSIKNGFTISFVVKKYNEYYVISKESNMIATLIMADYFSNRGKFT